MNNYSSLWKAPREVECTELKGTEYVEVRPTVYSEDLSPIYTGLLDANGHAIYRTPQSYPVGFLTFGD